MIPDKAELLKEGRGRILRKFERDLETIDTEETDRDYRKNPPMILANTSRKDTLTKEKMKGKGIKIRTESGRGIETESGRGKETETEDIDIV